MWRYRREFAAVFGNMSEPSQTIPARHNARSRIVQQDYYLILLYRFRSASNVLYFVSAHLFRAPTCARRHNYFQTVYVYSQTVYIFFFT